MGGDQPELLLLLRRELLNGFEDLLIVSSTFGMCSSPYFASGASPESVREDRAGTPWTMLNHV